MPVVSGDWRDPALWLRPGTAWGVVRDGSTLRLCRKTAAGKTRTWTCAVEEWTAGAEPREKLLREVEKGAALSAGLQPHRVLIRELRSPLADPRKSSEIWESLLDAAMPIPLESCQVAFPPPVADGEGGLRCVAAAARIADIEASLEEWRSMGLDPDFLFPEALTLGRDRESRIWLGGTRTVFAAWRDERFLGAGGCPTPERRRKAVGRFRAGLEGEGDSIDLNEVGPEAGREEALLESRLAEAALRPHPLNVNLRTGGTARSRRRTEYSRKWRGVGVAAALLAAALVLLPLVLHHYLEGLRREKLARMSVLYRDLAGRPSPAPGQEPLLARRYVAEEWAPVWNRAVTLSDPVVTTLAGRLLEAAAEAGAPVKSLSVSAGEIDVTVLGSESAAASLMETLRREGLDLEAEGASAGVWRLKGGWR